MNVSNFNPERRTRVRTAIPETKFPDKGVTYLDEIESDLDKEIERLVRIEKKIQQLARKRDEIEHLIKEFKSGAKISPSFSISSFEF